MLQEHTKHTDKLQFVEIHSENYNLIDPSAPKTKNEMSKRKQ